MRIRDELWPFKLFISWQYLANGALYPFLSLFLSSAGLDGVQIGLLLGLTPIITLLALPVWGIVADVLDMRRRLLTAACIMSAIAALFLPQARSYLLIAVALLALTLVRSPIGPIFNAITMEAISPRRERFPQIRLWGSLTWAIASVIVGAVVIDRNINWIIPIFAIGMMIAAVVSRRLPSSRANIGVRWWQAGDVVRHNPPFLIFTLAMVMLQFTHPLATVYLPLYFRELGAPGWMIGALWGISSVLEVPFMAATPGLIRRFGAKPVLVGLTLMVPLRWLLYRSITVPALMLPFQFMHSAAAAAYYAAAITYVDTLCPPRWRATGQSFYGAMSDGLGIGGGSLFFGWVYQNFGMSQAFTVGAAVAMVGWLVLVFGVEQPKAELLSAEQGA